LPLKTSPCQRAAPGQFSYTDDLATPGVTEGFGLMFYVARFYDSYLNRWIQPDSIVPDPGNSTDWDRYSYVRNNPLKYRDSSGHWPDWGGIISGAQQVANVVSDFTVGFVSEGLRVNFGFMPQVQDALAVNSAESDAMLMDRVAADAGSIILGIAEASAGLGMGAGGAMVSCGTTLCAGAVATTAASAAVVAAGVVTAGNASASLGSNLALLAGSGSTPKGFADSSQLTDHFTKHRAEFGFNTESQYLQGAQNFIGTEGNTGVLSRVRANGDKVLYNPSTNEFAVVASDGTIRTYFKPDPDIHGYQTNLDYYNSQK